MVGRDSLWQQWRKSLPSENEIRAAARKRLKLWAAFFDPDPEHSNHVAKLALQLFDGLAKTAQSPIVPSRAQKDVTTDSREILQLAAVLHGIGQAEKDKRYEKATYRLIRRMKTPLGWSAENWKMVAVVARFHRRILPAARLKSLRDFSADEKNTAYRLVGILRLAEALDSGHDQRIPNVEVREQNGIIVISAQGYSARDTMAERIAGARHLLEVVYRRPVMVKPFLLRRRKRNKVLDMAS
jgi:exopolyphosphatase/guanosine-5'-triphosphate,3'-diphosphate pyrophosphatase